MNKEFIPYEQALALKELDFDEPCLGWYQDNTLRLDINSNQSIKFHEHLGRFKGCFLAPTFSQAFRWFREKHSDLDFGVAKIHNGTTNYHYHINLQWEFFEGTYEEAELACLIKLIEIVKQI